MASITDFIPDLEPKGSTNGGEYAAPCPDCGGEDRFRVWPDHPDHDSGYTWCRKCDWSMDGISFLRQERGHSFREACQALGVEHKLNDSDQPDGEDTGSSNPPPNEQKPHSGSGGTVSAPSASWQQTAEEFVSSAKRTLRDDTEAAERARSYLQEERGLSEKTIRDADLGLHPKERYDDYANWGFEESGTLWLPRGIVIPWMVDGEYWRVSLRRPPHDVHGDDTPDHKYHMVKGSSGKTLYNADEIEVDTDGVLVEGVFDALVIGQEVDDVTAVATGSTSGARAQKWRVRLSICGDVLVAFDAGEAGESASSYWIDALPNAVRWRPHDHDVNDLYLSGANLEDWVQRGLTNRSSGTASPTAQDTVVSEVSSTPNDSEEDSLPDPELEPGPVPANIPLPSGESIAIYRKEMRDGYPGIALDLPYDENFIHDLKSTLRGWVREWRSQEGVWVVDLPFYEYALEMIEHHYGVEWRQKRFNTGSMDAASPDIGA